MSLKHAEEAITERRKERKGRGSQRPLDILIFFALWSVCTHRRPVPTAYVRTALPVLCSISLLSLAHPFDSRVAPAESSPFLLSISNSLLPPPSTNTYAKRIGEKGEGVREEERAGAAGSHWKWRGTKSEAGRRRRPHSTFSSFRVGVVEGGLCLRSGASICRRS